MTLNIRLTRTTFTNEFTKTAAQSDYIARPQTSQTPKLEHSEVT